jgi:hypothetical protein
MSFLLKISEQTVAKHAFIKASYSKDHKIRLLLNSVFEAQMQMMSGIRNTVIQYFEIDENDGHLKDYVWSACLMKVISD